MSLSYLNKNYEYRSLPLQAVKVTGEFMDCLGEVIVKQKWTKRPISTNYKFSLDSNAVVSGFKMTIGDRNWSGVVKEKEKARSEYQEAVATGKKSSLLEKISSNDYQVNVGPMDPNDSLEVEFSYFTRAEVQTDGSFRFVLPTNIAPKYKSPTSTDQADYAYDASMSSIPYVSDPLYSFEVDLVWRSASALTEVVSPTDPIATTLIDSHSARVRCSTAPANGDFTLCVKTTDATCAYRYDNETEQTTFLYVHSQIPSEEVAAAAARRITFVVDRSGSMEGRRIKQAVAAIGQFLSLLRDPANLINVVSFGDSYKAMWSNAVPASAQNIAACRKKFKTFSADMGGTELLHCLSDVTKGAIMRADKKTEPVEGAADLEHVVVLLTDGEVSNPSSILTMLGQQTTNCRVMTIGIGSNADRKLVERVAAKTNGICRVLIDEADLTAALSDVMSYIGKQYYTGVRVRGYEAAQCSSVLYPAHPVDMFLRLSAEQFQEVSRGGLTSTARDPVHDCERSWPVAVEQCVAAGSIVERCTPTTSSCSWRKPCPTMRNLLHCWIASWR